MPPSDEWLAWCEAHPPREMPRDPSHPFHDEPFDTHAEAERASEKQEEFHQLSLEVVKVGDKYWVVHKGDAAMVDDNDRRRVVRLNVTEHAVRSVAPPLFIFCVEVETDAATWFESCGSQAELDVFIRGVKAGVEILGGRLDVRRTVGADYIERTVVVAKEPIDMLTDDFCEGSTEDRLCR